ncbi:MAG: ABC transporter ATP-binding protein [Deltaproteobacteria bacterium]|nr:ABC transporter ATP-binding protein [Deltaproteobacteria bacterium]
MIEMTNLTRRYGQLTAVDHVSCRIGRGEIIGLLGQNGAGKSTIMKMLTGFLEPSSGQIRIAGEELQTDPRRAQSRIGYLPENCPLYPEMSVVDFLDYTATLRGLKARERPEAIRRVIRQTELQAKATALIATLSRGYRQRVGVAQTLLHKPEILILDEPTNGLDPGQIEQMRELIRALGKTATVIISTHILQEVEVTCDRVLILRQGKLALDSHLAELTRGSTLRLSCGAQKEPLTEQLKGLPRIDEITLLNDHDDRCSYRLQVQGDLQQTAAEVARQVISAGWPLFSLHTEERSLEKIFHDITSTEVTADAA